MTRLWLRWALAAGGVLLAAAAAAREADLARIRDPAERLQAVKQSLAPGQADTLSEHDRVVRRDLLVSTLRELKRGDELRRMLTDWEQADASAERRQQWAFLMAESLREDAQPEAALAAYERVFTAHPETSTRWPEAQARIVDVLEKSGHVGDALKAAHVLWDAAFDSRAAAQRIADLLQSADKSPARADAVLAMQRYGPAGKDGIVGTADDPSPVLPTLGYPDGTARRKAFEAVAPTLGDDADASLRRGTACLYAGDPRAALRHFADALRRCDVASVGEVSRSVMTGFRALRGHGSGLDAVGQFIAYGPNGPAGGTRESGVDDPFAAVGLGEGSRQPGGLVPLSADELGAMQSLIRELKEAAGRHGSPGRQIAAIDAYRRTCEALVVFDRQEVLAWVLGALTRESDNRVLGALVRLGQAAAKSNQLNLAGVQKFEGAVTQVFDGEHQPVPEEVLNAFRLTDRTVKALEKVPPLGKTGAASHRAKP